MRGVVTLAVIAAMMMVAAPARADRATETPRTTPSLDIDLELGPRSFRFGSRIFGREGYAGGAWLNGETRSDGFSLDGRLEHGGKARNFKLDADIDEWVRRAVRWWSVIDL
jgi:hypothetical protein